MRVCHAGHRAFVWQQCACTARVSRCVTPVSCLLLSTQSFCAALHQELKEYYRLLSVLHSQVNTLFLF